MKRIVFVRSIAFLAKRNPSQLEVDTFAKLAVSYRQKCSYGKFLWLFYFNDAKSMRKMTPSYWKKIIWNTQKKKKKGVVVIRYLSNDFCANESVFLWCELILAFRINKIAGKTMDVRCHRVCEFYCCCFLYFVLFYLTLCDTKIPYMEVCTQCECV